MTAQTLQQTLTKARNASIARIVGIGLTLALLVAGALAYRNATIVPTSARVANSPAAPVQHVYTSPAQWSMGSAYDGGAYGSTQGTSVRAAEAKTHNPIRHGSSSAYDGGSYGGIDVAASVAMHRPILHASSSAYDGRSYGSPSTTQPLVGQSTVVSGLVFDGTTYRTAPITVNDGEEVSHTGIEGVDFSKLPQGYRDYIPDSR
jgi:hypothetical protein